MRKNSEASAVSKPNIKPGAIKKNSPKVSPRNSVKGNDIMSSLGKLPKIRQDLLTVVSLVKVIRRTTDLCQRIDWGLLTPDQQHSKVLDLSQLVINDIFALIASCYLDLPTKSIVNDFVRTFYPNVVGEEETRENETRHEQLRS